jgi:hypothetical protein
MKQYGTEAASAYIGNIVSFHAVQTMDISALLGVRSDAIKDAHPK